MAPEVSGDEEELKDGESILDRLPKKERKRLIKVSAHSFSSQATRARRRSGGSDGG